MNQYGTRARRYWQEYRPASYAAIEDPEAFFTDLGSQAEAQAEEMMLELAGDDPAGETYLQKVARVARAQQRREIVMAGIEQPPDPEGPGGLAASRFRPRSQDDLAPPGKKARAEANIAAITLLQALQEEGRPLPRPSRPSSPAGPGGGQSRRRSTRTGRTSSPASARGSAAC